MPHYVFVSHSSKDKDAAERVCSAPEQAGIRVWIAPRDILPGQSWGASIIKAINDCRAMVLILSTASNDSPQVMREVERAVSKRIGIIPVRIENIVPTESMEYFLGTTHWLDAFGSELESKLKKLVETVQATLQAQTGGTPPDTSQPAARSIQPKSAMPAGHVSVPIWVFMAAIAAVLIAGVAFWLLRHAPAGAPSTAQVITKPAPIVYPASATTSAPKQASVAQAKTAASPPSTEPVAVAVVSPPPQTPPRHAKKTLPAPVAPSSAKSAGAGQAKTTISSTTVTTIAAATATSSVEPTNPADQAKLGLKYMKGDGVPQDYARALGLFQKAADQGDAEAQLNLGSLYENGQGVPEDDAQALN
jgi:outer membrane biosynthesis protein TonB